MADDGLAETKWKRRFLLVSMVRLAALAVLMLGVAVAYTDLLRAGGWPQVGAILVVLGAIDALLAPRLLIKHWKREDQASR